MTQVLVRALRGATTLEFDSPDQIELRVGELFKEMMIENDLDQDSIVSIFVTATNDIHSKFPASVIRELGVDDVALLGSQEIEVEGAPTLAIRILIHLYTSKQKSELKHIYLHGAKVLRRDIAKDSK